MTPLESDTRSVMKRLTEVESNRQEEADATQRCHCEKDPEGKLKHRLRFGVGVSTQRRLFPRFRDGGALWVSSTCSARETPRLESARAPVVKWAGQDAGYVQKPHSY